MIILEFADMHIKIAIEQTFKNRLLVGTWYHLVRWLPGVVTDITDAQLGLPDVRHERAPRAMSCHSGVGLQSAS